MFEEYKKMQKTTKPLVTISKYGSFYFNLAAVEEFKLSKEMKIIYLYDAGTRLIGFKTTDKEDKNGFCFAKMGGALTLTSGNTFLKHYNITERQRKFLLQRHDENILYIDLNTPEE